MVLRPFCVVVSQKTPATPSSLTQTTLLYSHANALSAVVCQTRSKQAPHGTRSASSSAKTALVQLRRTRVHVQTTLSHTLAASDADFVLLLSPISLRCKSNDLKVMSNAIFDSPNLQFGVGAQNRSGRCRPCA